MRADRDHWWHELVARRRPSARRANSTPSTRSIILYTSGSTGKPKGVLHTTAGYLLGTTMTSQWVFDLKDNDIYWCTADVGWVTGHSYIVYGPLSNGATVVMYEGAPNWPDEGRFWQIIEKYQVTILYTAPTAIRAFIKWGDQWPEKYDLSSLRLLGSVGEPINPEAWMWYHRVIGQERCPIVDTWWQTETGAIMISPLPGVTATKPGSATRALPGGRGRGLQRGGRGGRAGGRRLPRADAALARDAARDLRRRRPLPRDLLVEVRKASTSPATGRASTPTATSGCSDGRRRDERLRAPHLDRSKSSARSSTIPTSPRPRSPRAPTTITGQAIVAFVTLQGGVEGGDAKLEELRADGREQIGPIAKPQADHLRRRAAEDAQRQDHAPAAARRRREPPARRHDDAARPRRDGPARGTRQGAAGERGLSPLRRAAARPRGPRA